MVTKTKERSAYRQLALVVEAVGTLRFFRELYAWIACFLTVDSFSAVLFRQDGSAVWIEDDSDSGSAQANDKISEYLNWAYLLDPYYIAYRGGSASGLYHLGEIAPDQFRQGRYFKEYYKAQPLADEYGAIVRLPDGDALQFSVGRAEGVVPFRAREREIFATIEPTFLAMIAAHCVKALPLGPASATGKVKAALDRFGSLSLTGRERDIVKRIFEGHSTKSIARLLDIVPGTVMVHRARIYDKLGIASQSELFALFIAAISSEAALECDDPLEHCLAHRVAR